MKTSTKIIIFAVGIACVAALATLCVVYFDNISKAVRSAIDWVHSKKQKVESITFDLAND